jgi:hypothetical protein
MEWFDSEVKDQNREPKNSRQKKTMKLEKNSMHNWDFKGREREKWNWYYIFYDHDLKFDESNDVYDFTLFKFFKRHANIYFIYTIRCINPDLSFEIDS